MPPLTEQPTVSRVISDRFKQPMGEDANPIAEAIGNVLGDLYKNTVLNQALPYEQREEEFWQSIKDSPDDLAIGVGILIRVSHLVRHLRGGTE